MAHTDVLIVGAGPTGLALALWLTRQGVEVRVVDKSNGPGEASRAMALQARTLELYRQLGLAEAVIEAGYKTPAMNLWARGRRRARIPSFEEGDSHVTAILKQADGQQEACTAAYLAGCDQSI